MFFIPLIFLLLISCDGTLIDPPQSTPVGTSHKSNQEDARLKVLGGGLKNVEIVLPGASLPELSELQAFPVDDLDLQDFGVGQPIFLSPAMEVTLTAQDQSRLVEFNEPVTILWPQDTYQEQTCVLMTSSRGSYVWKSEFLSYDESLNLLSMSTLYPGVYQLALCQGLLPEAFRDASFAGVTKGLRTLKVQLPSEAWGTRSHHMCGYLVLKDTINTILVRTTQSSLPTGTEIKWNFPIEPVEKYGVQISLWAQNPFQSCSLNEGESLSFVESDQRLDFFLDQKDLSSEETSITLGVEIPFQKVNLSTAAPDESIEQSFPSFARKICVEVSSDSGKTYENTFLSELGLFQQDSSEATFVGLGNDALTMNISFRENCSEPSPKSSFSWTQTQTSNQAFYMYPLNLMFTDNSKSVGCVFFRDLEKKASGFLTVSPKIQNLLYLPWASSSILAPSFEMSFDSSAGCDDLIEGENRSYSSHVLAKEIIL
ncbi:MAG: hypothetical protein AB8C84_11815 [Oligoflexales bacterium]